MKINLNLKDINGDCCTLKVLKHALSRWPDVDDDGNVRRVHITVSMIDDSPVLQIYSDDPKLEKDDCLY